MAMTRRDFLETAAMAAAGAAMPARVWAAPLKVLVIGGTGFLGPHTVRRLQERGHTVTVFNRGRTNPGLFPDVEKLRGDRKTDPKEAWGVSRGVRPLMRAPRFDEAAVRVAGPTEIAVEVTR